jgi:hypothetical protein
VAYFSYCPSICLEILSTSTRASVRTADDQAEIQTEYLPNTNTDLPLHESVRHEL